MNEQHRSGEIPDRETSDRETSDRGDRPADAVDNATGDRLLDGALHDAHAEVSPDPELDGPDDADPDPDVTTSHREQVRSVEEGDRQATSGALGETAEPEPR